MKSVRGLAVLLSLTVVFFLLSLSAFAQAQTESSQQDTSAENVPASGEHSISVPENYAGPGEQQAAGGVSEPSGGDQAQQPSPGAAPVPGHPLDPNDVATLTGKNDQRRQPGYNGAYYYPYGMTTDWFGVPQFGTPQFGTHFFSGPGSPFGNPFFGGFGHGRNFGPNTFFFGPGPGTSFFLGGPQFASPGMFFTPGQSGNFVAPPRFSHATGSQFGRHHQP